MAEEHDTWMSGLGVDIGALREAATNAASAVKDTASNVVDAAGDMASNVAEATSNVVDAAGNAASSAIDAAGDTASSAAQTVVAGAGNAVQEIADAGSSTDQATTSNIVGVLPDIPPREPPDPADDPNVVFAGENFRIKMLEGVSFGEVVGATSITVVVWDVDNSRSATYEYTAVILTGGTPVTFSGEGGWSDVHSASKPIQVDQFSGRGNHGEIGALSAGYMELFNAPSGITFKVPTGFSVGGGIESGPGGWSLVGGSVQVFKG
jgi:hypothetical protein